MVSVDTNHIYNHRPIEITASGARTGQQNGGWRFLVQQLGHLVKLFAKISHVQTKGAKGLANSWA